MGPRVPRPTLPLRHTRGADCRGVLSAPATFTLLPPRSSQAASRTSGPASMGLKKNPYHATPSRVDCGERRRR